MENFMSLFLALFMAVASLGNIPVRSAAQKSYSADSLVIADAENEKTSTTVDFYLGCDFHDIVYGDSQIGYNGNLYRFSNQDLVCVSDNTIKHIAKTDGDNLNISNGKLYYSAYNKGNAYIYAYDLNANTESEILCLWDKKIINMYVINDSYIEFLADQTVYTYDILTKSLKEVAAPKNTINFIPTQDGNFYASGSSVDSTIVFMGKELVSHATYYSIENGMFIATIDGTTYQMPVSKIVSRCNEAEGNGYIYSEICPLQDMEEYEFYGSYNVSDVLSLGDDEHDCEDCLCTEDDPALENSEDFAPRSVIGTAITPNARQQTIINRATEVVELVWTPLVSFARWHGNLAIYPNTYANTYIANEPYTGLPYSRLNHFSSTVFNQVYIGFGSFADGTLSSLDGFLERVANPNDPFNQAASTTNPNIKNGGYGALYGMDCSRFVCYSWGYNPGEDHTTEYYYTDTKCYQLTSQANGDRFELSDLAVLLPGDAFVKSDGHAILVTAVYKDSNGGITRIETMEELSPRARKHTYGNGGERSLSYLLNNILAPNDDGTPYQIYRLKEYVNFMARPGTVDLIRIHIISGKTYGFFNNGVLPVPVREGYRFTGWYTDATAGTKITAGTLVQNTSARILYAHWVLLPAPIVDSYLDEVNKLGNSFCALLE